MIQNRRKRKSLHPPRPKDQTARRTSLPRTRRAVHHRGKCRPHLRQSLRGAGSHASTFVPAPAATPVPRSAAPPARAAATAAAASKPAGSGRAGCAEGFAACGAQVGEGLLCCYVGLVFHTLYICDLDLCRGWMLLCARLKVPRGWSLYPDSTTVYYPLVRCVS